MSEQSDHNHQTSEVSQENDFPENFYDLFDAAYEKEVAAAAAAPALASEPQASAPLAENGQVDETSEEDGFFYDFETDIEKAQEAAAAAVLASEPQVENGQVDEDAEENGFPVDFNKEFDEEYEKEQRAATAVAVASVIPAPQQKAKAESKAKAKAKAKANATAIAKVNDELAVNLGMQVDGWGILRSKTSVAERRARQRAMRQAMEQAEREERERRIASYQASGTSMEQPICLN